MVIDWERIYFIYLILPICLSLTFFFRPGFQWCSLNVYNLKRCRWFFVFLLFFLLLLLTDWILSYHFLLAIICRSVCETTWRLHVDAVMADKTRQDPNSPCCRTTDSAGVPHPTTPPPFFSVWTQHIAHWESAKKPVLWSSVLWFPASHFRQQAVVKS